MPNKSLLIIAIGTVLVACIPSSPTPSAPKPAELATSKSPEQVIKIASRVLTDADFEIAAMDANAGVLTAKRQRTQTGNSTYVRCQNHAGEEGHTQSVMAKAMTTIVTVNVSARSDSGATHVRMNGRVLAQYKGIVGVGDINDSEKDCVSSGAIEQRIVDALSK